MRDRTIAWLAPVWGGGLLLGVWYSLRHVFGAPAWALPMPHEIVQAVTSAESTFIRAAVLTARFLLRGVGRSGHRDAAGVRTLGAAGVLSVPARAAADPGDRDRAADHPVDGTRTAQHRVRDVSGEFLSRRREHDARTRLDRS